MSNQIAQDKNQARTQNHILRRATAQTRKFLNHLREYNRKQAELFREAARFNCNEEVTALVEAMTDSAQ